MKEITMYNEQDVQNLVSIQDKKVVTTSLQVAQAFEKKHKHVIEAIETKLQSTRNFGSSPKNVFCRGIFRFS